MKKGGFEAGLTRTSSTEKKYLYNSMKQQGYSDEEIKYEISILDLKIKENHIKAMKEKEKEKDFKEEFKKLTTKKYK